MRAISGRREGFHGLGGRHRGTDLRGEKVYGWVEQENAGGPDTLRQAPLVPILVEAGTRFTYEQLGVPPLSPAIAPGREAHYMFPNGPNAAYYVQNHFVSSAGYGFLLGQPQLSRWRLANDRPDRRQVAASAAALDYTVFPGRPAQATRKLTARTGRHRLPPRWAQGPTLWRAIQVGEPAETRETALAKVEGDLREIDARRVPVSASPSRPGTCSGPT